MNGDAGKNGSKEEKTVVTPHKGCSKTIFLTGARATFPLSLILKEAAEWGSRNG